MTRTMNARIAGFTYLFYTAVGSTLHVLMNRATNAEGTAATLALVAEHASDVRVSVVLSLLESCSALVLAVSLYGITRDQDHELAMLALACRVGEGVMGAISIPLKLGLLWLGQDRKASTAAGRAALRRQSPDETIPEAAERRTCAATTQIHGSPSQTPRHGRTQGPNRDEF